MRDRDVLHLGAGHVPRVGQPQQRAHLVQCETEFAGTTDEGQTLDMGASIGTMPAFGAGGFRQHADFLVEADGLDIAARARSQRPDRDQRPDGADR